MEAGRAGDQDDRAFVLRSDPDQLARDVGCRTRGYQEATAGSKDP
jgi:hypothetical protein